ncbi:MAG TPA: PEGA domain-containing protein, partial [Myxococcota bacterium]
RLLVGSAGPAETGKAETPQGQRARAHLERALKNDPTLTLDPASTPPKMRALLQLASEAVKAGGHGGMSVASTPAGMTVYLDGRALGLTPMTTAADSIPAGPYRLWLAAPSSSSSSSSSNGGTFTARSFARVVDIGEIPLEVDINVVVEGAIDADAVSLVTPIQPLTPPEVRRLVQLSGAQELVVAGRHDGHRFVAVFDDQGTVVRHGVVDDAIEGAAAVDAMASYAAGQGSSNVRDEAIAADVYGLQLVAAGDAPVDDAGPPWALIGIGAGVGAVVVAGGVLGLLYVTRQGTMDISMELR